MAYDLGDPVPLSIQIKDSAGVLANATLVTLTITNPDGTSSSATITPTTTGVYQHTYVPSAAGRYLIRWQATGTNASAYTDSFDVNDPTDLALLSLSDAKQYLNITNSTSDEELREFIVAATDIAERLTSRQLRRKTYTDTYTGSTQTINLRNTPIVSVTSVTENGATLTENTDYVVDTVLGILTRGTSTQPRYWKPGAGNITVTYVAGETNPSPTAQLLVKEITRHLWRTQRGASPMSMGQDDFIPGGNNIVTYRIKELAELLTVPTVA